MGEPSLLTAAVALKLKKSLGGLSDVQIVSGGQESKTFRFRAGGRPYIVRLNESVEGFEKDAFACRRFARRELPIPDVIEIDRADDGRFYCLSECAPGATLQDLDAQELPQVLEPAAKVLEAIAESPLDGVKGWGPFDASGNGTYDAWHNFLTAVADPARYDWTALQDVPDQEDIDRLIYKVQELAEPCPEKRGLIHGDFGSNNVMVEKGRVTAVIDWSEASIGDPLYDVANIFYWRAWLDCMEQQARYFESTLNHLPEINKRLLCYQLRIGLSEIYQNARIGKISAFDWHRNRCRELERCFRAE